MTKATERLFDTDGVLVASVGDEIPEGVETRSAKAVFGTPADTEYPAGKPGQGTDPVDEGRTAPTGPALLTPLEQVLVDQGQMAPRDSAIATSPSTPAPATPDPGL